MQNKVDRRCEAEYAEMEKHCPEKVRKTTRQPVAALEYQRQVMKQKEEEEEESGKRNKRV